MYDITQLTQGSLHKYGERIYRVNSFMADEKKIFLEMEEYEPEIEEPLNEP